jgi:hypothetical protein
MADEESEKLPTRWWAWVRLAAILVTIWMAIGFFVMQHSFDSAAKMSVTRTDQAAQLAGVPLTSDEQTYFGPSSNVSPVSGGDRPDQIVAIGSLAAFESDRASDSVSGMIATATAGVGSLVVFLSGLRDWLLLRKAKRASKAGTRRSITSPSPTY